jgi:tetratricopeptide (TPR) repeat protein
VLGFVIQGWLMHETAYYQAIIILIIAGLFVILSIYLGFVRYWSNLSKSKRYQVLQLSTGKSEPLQLYNLATESFNDGDFDNAILLLQKTIKIVPYFAEAYYALGLTYARIGQHHEAIKAFKGTLQKMPNCPGAIFNLAISYLLVGDKAAATSQLKFLKTFDPLLAEKLFNLLNSSQAPKSRQP